jgi:hypothetical protein
MERGAPEIGIETIDPVVPLVVRPPARTMLDPVANATARVVAVARWRWLTWTSRWAEPALARVTDGRDPPAAPRASRHAIDPNRREERGIERERPSTLEDADRNGVDAIRV